jgi:hypothetical protein
MDFYDFLASDEFSNLDLSGLDFSNLDLSGLDLGDLNQLAASTDISNIDFSKVKNVFSDADIEAFANLGSGSYGSINDAIADYAEKSGQDLATAQQKFAASGLKLEDLPGVSKLSSVKNALKSFGLVDDKGVINPIALLGLTGLLSAAGQGSKSTPAPSGYQGTVPKYTAIRERVPIPQDPNRRPGAGGRRYFSDVSFAAPGTTPAETQAAIDTARAAAKAQAETLKPALYPIPQVKAPEQEKTTEVIKPSPASGVAQLLPVPKYDTKGNVIAAGGGLMGMAKGRYLNGSTDGMEDKIPATISGKQPARLSHGEFVVPADVVSHLGNGNSNAGTQRLYDMMDRVRKARTGNPKQGKQINPNKYLPK